jgi:hypothetical protein
MLCAVTEAYATHKRSKISADFPSLTKQIAEEPKTLELVEGGLISED